MPKRSVIFDFNIILYPVVFLSAEECMERRVSCPHACASRKGLHRGRCTQSFPGVSFFVLYSGSGMFCQSNSNKASSLFHFCNPNKLITELSEILYLPLLDRTSGPCDFPLFKALHNTSGKIYVNRFHHQHSSSQIFKLFSSVCPILPANPVSAK